MFFSTFPRRPLRTKDIIGSFANFCKERLSDDTESVYCKLALNTTVANSVVQAIKSNKPPEGLVQMLVITEKQYARMEFVVGNANHSIIDSDERVVIL